MDDLPGQPMASRPVHFFWIVDASSSMAVDGKMARLDHAIREALPLTRAVAAENPGAELLLRVLAFSNGARWITSDPVPVEEFTWSSLPPDGMTDLGDALTLVSSQLEIPPMPQRALPPVLVLVTDGLPTDDWKAGLAELNRATWGKKAIRIAIDINIDGSDRTSVFSDFTGNSELVLSVDTPEKLAKAIRWASTTAVKVASDPAAGSAGSRAAALVPQIVIDDDDDDVADDAWI